MQLSLAERRSGLADLEDVSLPAGQPEVDESLEGPDDRCVAPRAVAESEHRSELPEQDGDPVAGGCHAARRRSAQVADGLMTGR